MYYGRRNRSARLLLIGEPLLDTTFPIGPAKGTVPFLLAQKSGQSPMPYGLYISAEGAQAQTRRLDIIANNIANVDTVGFKRDLAVMQSRYSEAIEKRPGVARRSGAK